MMHAPMQQPINLELLIKLMKMTTSATDGEALAAIRMANRQLQLANGDWEVLLRGKMAPIDPFASLPMPKAAEPPPPPRQPMSQHYHYPSSPPSPPPPPPSPVYYGLNAKEAKDITTWLVTCEFASFDSHTTRVINHIEIRWRNNKKLDSSDYNTLRTTAAKVKKRRSYP